MPTKYHIHVEPTEPRYKVEGKLGIVDWREDCASCQNCVKKSCVFNIYSEEKEALDSEKDYLDYIYECKGCLACVQNCTKNILTRIENPEYSEMGDSYYNSEIILSTWFQAETGKIPVSGCGYGGMFSGPGFDSMWTDMSEIVRPTRDGIHGREYINTGVDIGRKLDHLEIKDGELLSESPPIVTTPLPLLFDALPECFVRGSVRNIILNVASDLDLYAVVPEDQVSEQDESVQKNIVPLLSDSNPGTAKKDAPMVIVPDSEKVLEVIKNLKAENPDRVIVIRVEAAPEVNKRVVKLVHAGAEVVNLQFDRHGRENCKTDPRHARDVIRDVHTTLIKEEVRDEVTVISSGGIALPEHMAKAILCGADLVTIDIPLVLAIECRLCGECEDGHRCSIHLEDAELEYGKRRMTNLMGTWHSQLLELMGAMGIREARRLRGETGRCMFFEDLEEKAFGSIFGKRKIEFKA